MTDSEHTFPSTPSVSSRCKIYVRPLFDDGRLLASLRRDVDPLLYEYHWMCTYVVKPLLVDASDRRHGTSLLPDPQRPAWLVVPSHRARGPHTPRERLRGTEVSIGTVGAESTLGVTRVEEGEVVAVPEGRARCGGLVWVTGAGSIARWEGDVEVGEVGWGEGVGEDKRLARLGDPCVECSADVG